MTTTKTALGVAHESTIAAIRVTSGRSAASAGANSIIDRAEELHAAETATTLPASMGSSPCDLHAASIASPDEPSSWIFFDVETCGLNPRYDQILQIGMIRCDRDLNEIDSFEMRCDLSPWIVPSPAALLVTRTPPVLLTSTGNTIYDLIDAVAAKLEAWRDAPAPAPTDRNDRSGSDDDEFDRNRLRVMHASYNGLAFDEEFLRHALFAALHPPYLTQSIGCRRFDVLLALRTAHALQPSAVVVPEERDPETGTTRKSFKLGAIAAANGIEYDADDLHDALADVRLTIAVARLIRERAPSVWQACLEATDAKAMTERLLAQWDRSSSPRADHGILQAFVHIEYRQGRLSAQPLLPIGVMPDRSRTIVCINLAIDPGTWTALDDDDLRTLLKSRRSPLICVRTNRQPVLLSLGREPDGWPAMSGLAQPTAPDTAGGMETAVGIISKGLEHIHQVSMSDPAWSMRLLTTAAEAQPAWPPAIHVEDQLYTGFASRQDQTLAYRMLQMSPDQFVQHVPALQDPRMREHAWRRAYIQHPEALPAKVRQRLDHWRHERLHAVGDGKRWRSLADARAEVGRIRDDALAQLAAGVGECANAGNQLAILAQIDEWIGACIAKRKFEADAD